MSARSHRGSGSKSSSSRARRAALIIAVLITLFLLGTVIVLSSISYYLRIPLEAYLTENEVPWRPQDVIKPLIGSEDEVGPPIHWDDVTASQGVPTTHHGRSDAIEITDTTDYEHSAVSDSPSTPDETANDGVWGIDGKGSGGYWMREGWDGKVENTASWEHLYNVTVRPGEKAPRIIHQTWKSDTLPKKWQKSWRECREGMQDYEYMLWTDELSLQFVKTHYPTFLPMFEGYQYPIQRADSIRYFVLHHFGGIYMDLDMGCRRRMDPLLKGDWEVILPVTKPVGVSNDLIVSSPKSDFMTQTVHGLPGFDHNWIINYPTVMFTTGPMFLSSMYAMYSARHPTTDAHPHADVRILPTSLYGKNAIKSQVPHSFFSHFYGSSWHDGDAGFITFLATSGRGLMVVGAIVVVLLAIRLVCAKLFPSASLYGMLWGMFGSGPVSPTYESAQPQFGGALRRAGNILLAAPATLLSSSSGGDRRRQRGWLYFAPTMFQPQQTGRRRTASEASQLPPRRTLGRREQPPPYESATANDDDGMGEVDAFLKRETSEIA
ncbi:hypothetical protein VHUM_03184 [Vanrija humicola]|uniref:Glycosyltransferase family 32 protein n=1 Tax=Vanrija humicola TaxID=5417 RepID=A0A7D8Z2F4_VANHU|nr:hypothetical protein VHUM_03184 [Vanrija humicola]